MSYGSFKNVIYKLFVCKQDLALNNLQGLICHKTIIIVNVTFFFNIVSPPLD